MNFIRFLIIFLWKPEIVMQTFESITTYHLNFYWFTIIRKHLTIDNWYCIVLWRRYFTSWDSDIYALHTYMKFCVNIVDFVRHFTNYIRRIKSMEMPYIVNVNARHQQKSIRSSMFMFHVYTNTKYGAFLLPVIDRVYLCLRKQQ